MNESDKRVVTEMIRIYCCSNHISNNGLCNECETLNAYAMKRLENCPFGENKPTCGMCSIHCYKKDMRMRIREVMRFSGPKMLLKHPLDTINHFYREFKRKRLYTNVSK